MKTFITAFIFSLTSSAFAQQVVLCDLRYELQYTTDQLVRVVVESTGRQTPSRRPIYRAFRTSNVIAQRGPVPQLSSADRVFEVIDEAVIVEKGGLIVVESINQSKPLGITIDKKTNKSVVFTQTRGHVDVSLGYSCKLTPVQ